MRMTSTRFFSVLFLTSLVLMVCIPTAFAAPTVEYITSTQQWTCPQNIFIIQAKVVGSGAGGSGGNRSIIGPAGRNATTVYVSDYPVVPGQQYLITIGTPGIGGLSPDESTGSFPPSAGAGGHDTTAFGATGVGQSGGNYLAPASPNALPGYGSVVLATNGQDGYGSATSTIGGYGGVGYGAGGGGGGYGGVGGHGGNGGNGAPGVVEITYDIDASNVLFAGTTYDAITGATVSGASVVLVQGTKTVNANVVGSTFSVPSSAGLRTGYSTTQTVTKAGYYTHTFTFVPYVSEIVPQNIGLIPTTFDRSANGTISGIVMNQYGSTLDSASITLTNSTGGVLSTTSTTRGFYSFLLVPKMTTWAAVASKTGYANSSTVFEMGYY